MERVDLSVEDIFSDSLSGILGEEISKGDDQVRFGDLVLSVAPKEGKAITLLADHLFSPALLLAERIERGLLPLGGRTVIELGAGCALPSLLAATLSRPPALVVVTDYPDAGILGNLQKNVRANEALVNPACSVQCRGYDWGTDVKPLMDLLPQDAHRAGYDAVLLSDLLHFHSAHAVLVSSLTSLLARTPAARAHVAAGTYTAPHVCAGFLRLAAAAGVVFEEGAADGVWRGATVLRGVSAEHMGARKAQCRWWTGRWADAVLEAASGRGAT